MWSEVTDSLLDALATDVAAAALARRLEADVVAGSHHPDRGRPGHRRGLLGTRHD